MRLLYSNSFIFGVFGAPIIFQIIFLESCINKENNVFKDALGVKGLGFKHHGNHPCNHGSHYGNHHGNYHDNHSNHHGNYHAEQLLFSCHCSKVAVYRRNPVSLGLIELVPS